MDFERDIWIIIGGLQQLNLKQMLNTKPLGITGFHHLNIFRTPFSSPPNHHSRPSPSAIQPLSSLQSQSQSQPQTQNLQQQTIITQPIKLPAHNPMQQEVQWFNCMSLYEAIVKIGIVLFGSICLWGLGLYSGSTALCVVVVGVLGFGGRHGVFQGYWMRKWVGFSLLISIFVLTNQIFITTLNILSPKTAQLLYYNHLTLLPSIPPTILITLYSLLSPLSLNPLQTCQRSYRNSLTLSLYLRNLSTLFRQLYLMRYVMLKCYGVFMLGLYVGVCWLRWEVVLWGARGYTGLVYPAVFVGQAGVFLWLVLLYHTLAYLIDQPIFWNLTPWFYSTINSYSRMPRILQLLRVVPSSEIKSQIARQGLQSIYRVFSFNDKAGDNKLTRRREQNIYMHSLAWIITYLSTHQESLTKKIQTYNTTHNNLSTRTSLQQLFLEFSNNETQKFLQVLSNLLVRIEQVNVLKVNRKYLWEDLLYWGRRELGELRVWGCVRDCMGYCQVAEMIVQVCALAGVDFGVGGVVQFRSRLERLADLAGKIGGVEWLEDIVRDRMNSLNNKIANILNRVSK